MIGKQSVLWLMLFHCILSNLSYSASNLSKDTKQINKIGLAANPLSVKEEIPSWGPYSRMTESIEKVQAATVVLGFSTAVMISDSFAITAAHCPLDGDKIPDYIWARNIHGQTVEVTGVWYDLAHDFAIIQMEHPFDISCAVPIASTNALAHDTVFTIGHPENVQDSGLGWAVSFGHAYGLKDDDMSCFDINSTNGFSGGPICNSKGEVLSVTSAMGTGYYWKDKPLQYPYFNEEAPVRNEVLEAYMGYPTSYGAPLDFIRDFLAKHNIKPKPGGNFSLPLNKPDLPRVPFVSQEELAQIELVSPSSRHSTVAFGRDKMDIWPMARGTGVLIAKDLVLTASHVVEKSWTAHAVGFTNGTRYDECTVFATHPLFDLAIVKLPKAAPEGFEPVKMAEHPVHWEEAGYVIGHPKGVWQPEGGWQVTTALGLGADKGGAVFKGSGQSGNSGGGIFNKWGDLAGILWWSARTSNVRSPWDVQDPHATDYWPTAQTDEGSFIGGPEYNGIKEFVSRYTAVKGNVQNYGFAVATMPDGHIATTGRSFNGTDNDVTVTLYDKLGNLIKSFSSTQKNAWEAGRGLTVLPDGKIIVVGNTHDQKQSRFLILCLNADGSPDIDFGVNGQRIIPVGIRWDEAIAVKVQEDGKILVAGTTYNGMDNDFALLRLYPNGTLDSSFGNGGIFIAGIQNTSDDYLMDMEIQKDQRIVLAGYSDFFIEDSDSNWDFVTMRVESNGSLDTDFGNTGWVRTDIRNNKVHDAATCLAIQEDGKIVVGGYTDRGGNPDVALVRYLPDGLPDPDFGNRGIALISDAGRNFPDYPHDLAIRSNGKFLLAGENWLGTYSESRYGTRHGSYNAAVWGLNSDGSIDTNWGTMGLVSIDSGIDDYIGGIALSPDAVALAGYSCKDGNSEPTLNLIKIQEDNNAPADIILSKSVIDESSANGSLVGILYTIDPNRGDSFAYSLVPGNGDSDNASFTISENKLLTNTNLDYETKSTYSICLQTMDSGNNTFVKSFTIHVNNVIETSIDKGFAGKQVTIYPNPTSDFLYIETNNDEIASLKLYSDMGIIILQKELKENKTQINLQNVAGGVYFLFLTNKNKMIYQQKIIKK